MRYNSYFEAPTMKEDISAPVIAPEPFFRIPASSYSGYRVPNGDIRQASWWNWREKDKQVFRISTDALKILNSTELYLDTAFPIEDIKISRASNSGLGCKGCWHFEEILEKAKCNRLSPCDPRDASIMLTKGVIKAGDHHYVFMNPVFIGGVPRVLTLYCDELGPCLGAGYGCLCHGSVVFGHAIQWLFRED